MQVFTTPYGELVPQYSTDDLRRKELQPVQLYADGNPRLLPLESQTVIKTPAGPVPAECVSFHPNGTIKRVFPLNGKLSGYWTEADEAGLAKPVVLRTPAGTMTVRVISICFYESQALRSITLWPDEVVSVQTPVGMIRARSGVSFYPDGSIRSLEPAQPTPVMTDIGEVIAYDSDAVGINGDTNSLTFSRDGSVVAATTVSSRITVVCPDGSRASHVPSYRESLCGDSEHEVAPMQLTFSDQTFDIRLTPKEDPLQLDRERYVFFTTKFMPPLPCGLGRMACAG